MITYCTKTRLAQRQGLESAAFEPVEEIPSPTPTMMQAYTVISALADRWPDLTINFTGATKPMSIAAYLVAKERRLKSLYCDTEAGRIVPGGTAEGEPDMDIHPVFRSLKIEMLMAAAGKTLGKDWQYTPRTPEEIELGNVAFRLMSQPNSGYHAYLRKVKKSATSTAELPETPKPHLQTFLAQAYQAGAIERNNGLYHLWIDPVIEQRWGLPKAVDSAIAAIDGFPFEYYVLGQIQRSKRYIHPHSSVEPVNDAVSFGETDLVCMDTEKLGLTFISCKKSQHSASKLEHLEAFISRCNMLGGRFSRKILCIGYLIFEEKPADIPTITQLLRNRCTTLGIDLLIGPEIQAHFASNP